jgi:Tfp pilus assembly ATPase PilU
MATTLIMNLRVLISQRLLLHADQKRRVAIREYLVVKARHRDALMETPIEKMPLLMDRFVNEDGCSFLKAAKKLFEEGEILKDAYDQICLEME